ncbi:MAG: RidA family protein [Bacillota bacterium]|jgi:enamine deaminase RidA (YjgF/YER057c/UK114 family)
MNAEQRIKELGYVLPTGRKPMANYVLWKRVGNMVYLSGHGCNGEEETWVGKVGKDLTVEQGYEAARSCGLALLATLKSAIGDLDKVKNIVKVLGMVNSADDFGDQPKVINGASDLFVEVFGEKGRHARSAVGMAGLPRNIPVEIEMIVEVEPE